MSLAWDESLATGISEIDEQHKEIFSRFKGFSDACRESQDINELNRLVVFLEDYTATHFEFEERAMRRTDYPGLSKHYDEHRSFINDFHHLKEKIAVGEKNREAVFLAERIMIKWLIIHIGHFDQELAEHFRSIDRLNAKAVNSA